MVRPNGQTVPKDTVERKHTPSIHPKGNQNHAGRGPAGCGKVLAGHRNTRMEGSEPRGRENMLEVQGVDWEDGIRQRHHIRRMDEVWCIAPELPMFAPPSEGIWRCSAEGGGLSSKQGLEDS